MKNFIIKLLGGYTQPEVSRLIGNGQLCTHRILLKLFKQPEKFPCAVRSFYKDFHEDQDIFEKYAGGVINNYLTEFIDRGKGERNKGKKK